MTDVITKSRYYQKSEKEHEKWLTKYLNFHEIVLAWLSVYSVMHPTLKYERKKKISWRYLLTNTRQVLVAFGDEGKTSVFELPEQAFYITSSLGRDTITVDKLTWKTEFKNEYLYKEIKELPGIEEKNRTREAARLNWIHGEGRKKNAQFVVWLLSELTQEGGDPRDCLSHAFIKYQLDSKKGKKKAHDFDLLKDLYLHCLKKILKEDEVSIDFKEWAQQWAVPAEQQIALVHLFFEIDLRKKIAPLILSLHRQGRELILKEQKDTLSRIIIDLGFAQHLLDVQKYDEAVPILEKCLSRLPHEFINELTPSKKVNLTEAECGSMKCRTLELLAEARGEPNSPDLKAIISLAQLQPLVSRRINALIDAASGSLKRRAQKIHHILESPDGLAAHEEEYYSHKKVNPLSKKLIEEKIPYNATQKGGYFDSFQNWLGKAKIPDHSILKSYAERATPQKYPSIIKSLGDAALALGVNSVDAYISRGQRSFGIRAFEGTPPFLLIGIEHLEPESDYYMRFSEMRFAIATEVAHLRFHHTRLTSDELWEGIFHKGKQVLEAVSLLAGPIGFIGNALRGVQRLSAAQQLISKAQTLTLGAARAVDFLGFAREVKDSALAGMNEKSSKNDDTISDDSENLLAACRMMQLTADRAGLVLCGNIRPAIRAIFLTSRTCCGELSLAERYGLIKVLNRKNEDSEFLNQELAIRLASLCSFYLSEDFIELRRVLTGVEVMSDSLDYF
jgi:hypothetical protein